MLSVEALEDRMMLSSVQIFAAGSENTETLQLQIDQATVQTWNNVGGDAFAGQFVTLNYQTDADITADQVRLVMPTDVFGNGVDENLRIDAIVIDGVRFETESPNVFSTGTWFPEDGIVPGFRESEFLHANGFLQFADDSSDDTTSITINARGFEGTESFALQIDGATVQSFENISTSIRSYNYTASGQVNASQIRIAFLNDEYDPAAGIDSNLLVDNIVVGNEQFETEAASVFSTGTWKAADGIQSGFGRGDTLHANGIFQFADSDTTKPGEISIAVSQFVAAENDGSVQVRFDRIGGSDGAATVFFQTVDSTAVSGTDYVGTNSQAVQFADGQTSATANIRLINDSQFESAESFSVSLFRAEGADLGDPRTSIVTITDDEADDDLVAYFKLDEDSIGQSVADSSGQGNSGVHINIRASAVGSNTPDFETIANTNSIFFNGINNYIAIDADASLNLSGGNFTQSVWIRPTNNNGLFQGILGFQGTATENRYPGIWLRGTEIHAGFGDGNDWNNVTTAGAGVTYGQWNHVATTFDGTTFKVFVNGREEISTNSFAGSTPINVQQVDIGRVNNYFTGNIDEVQIYKRALTATELTSLIDGATLPNQLLAGEFQTEVIQSGFNKPITIDLLADGRAYVAEQDGFVRLLNANGSVQSSPVLDISGIVNSGTKDRGLLGFAIHPDFENNRYIYVSYTYDPPEVNSQSGLSGADGNGARVSRISRFTVNAAGTFANANSEVILVGGNSTYDNIGTPDKRPGLNDPHSCIDAGGGATEDCIAADETSHTIGDLQFGPDGALYASTGDGGSFGRADPVNLRSLDIDSLAGKILRLDPITGEGLADNPFFNGDPDSNESKVYSYGLRNPFRIAVNQISGEVYAGDVGWTQWEEINTGRGANFGWPAFEGTNQTARYTVLEEVQDYYATNPDVTDPAWARLHRDGARAIILGDFLYGSQYGELEGGLIFTDIGDQIIRVATFNSDGSIDQVRAVSSVIGFLVDFQSDQQGNIYYTDIATGDVGILRFV